MKLITTHVGADFDSLASMVAAQKLYGGGILCFPGAASRNVREFLKKYPSAFHVLTPRKIKMEQVEMLIVVDTRSRSRLGPFAALLDDPAVEVHVYDHHPPSEDDIKGSRVLLESLGSVSSMMTELLLKEKIPMTSLEATLFALGIYEDTGGLTFASTTQRDFNAASNLLFWGADLSAIPAYLELSYTLEERRLLDLMIEKTRQRYIHGANVVLCQLDLEIFVEGIALFLHRIRDSFEADIALAVVGMEKRTHIVLRSKEEILDARKFLSEFGAGGHSQASAISLPRTDSEELMATLEHRLERDIAPLIEVQRVMSSPVMVVESLQRIQDVYRLMIRYGHGAFPVSDHRGRLVGMITRKDLDKAQLHGLGDVPVGDFMTEDIITISPHAPITEAHRTMALRNIGRLPVMDGDVLVGILTRTDLIRALYPNSLPVGERESGGGYPWVEQKAELLEERLSPHLKALLKKMGERAKELGMRAYLVGGVVRDLLLDRENLDLDVVVEGDALTYLRTWREDGCDLTLHLRFRTGTLVFPDGLKVDVATARREFYEYPVAAPTVSIDSLKHDLYRRDFTVNAMAWDLNGEHWGELIDYFGGRQDIARKSLRVLHNLSFIEDPSRMLRGVRLEARLGFTMEENTLKLVKNCVIGGLLYRVTGRQLRHELHILFTEEDVPKIIRRLQELCLLDALFPGICMGERSKRAIRRLHALLWRLQTPFILPEEGEWVVWLAALLTDTPQSAVSRICERLEVLPAERHLIERALMERGSAATQFGGRAEILPSVLYRAFKDVPPLVLLLWGVLSDNAKLRRRLFLYLNQLKHIEPLLTGGDLLGLGYTRGPEIGRILEEIKMAKLDGFLASREEEVSWALEKNPVEKINTIHALRKRIHAGK